jgi:hypothetical protein
MGVWGLLVPGARGQIAPPNLTGTWDVQTTALLFDAPDSPCVFEGSAEVAQAGSDFSGPITLQLIEGVHGCPESMNGSLEGQWQDNQIQMAVILGEGGLGKADFTGTAALVLKGPFLVTEGPFAGTTGTWSALPSQADSAQNLSGPWEVETTAFVGGQGGVKCAFAGNAEVTQDGNDLSGPLDVRLTEGPDEICPPDMTGSLRGQSKDGHIRLGAILSQELGEADFTGAPVLALDGSFVVQDGLFGGTTGSWQASPNSIFADSFESGDDSAWSESSPPLDN